MLRPPRLVGREREWAALEDAWARGQFIMVSGEPGVGKSRLVRDFAASKGDILFLEGRPGDVQVPYSTTTRNLRRILERRPDALDLLPGWVREALSSLLPELGGTGDAGHGEARLHEAVQMLFAVGMDGMAAAVYDDIQFADDASIRTGLVLISAGFPLGRPGGVPHMVCCYRRGELSAFTGSVFERLRDAGQGAIVDLDPLGARDVEALVAELALPDMPRSLPAQLTRFTGGNPLFVLETVKNLLEDGAAVQEGALPVPQKVGELITRRLERLPTAALQAARAAAVLASD
ncbi:AAA family ATPase, partial [Deinococcus pimensis]|uniref:AAA family ATPase n=1 Tax=Deinococcus pimensis TaxID=309888 RepID=UPI00146FAC09